jgi:hypothetical protein
MLHGLALAGVKSVKEVHRLIVAWGMRRRKGIAQKLNISNNLRQLALPQPGRPLARSCFENRLYATILSVTKL